MSTVKTNVSCRVLYLKYHCHWVQNTPGSLVLLLFPQHLLQEFGSSETAGITESTPASQALMTKSISSDPFLNAVRFCISSLLQHTPPYGSLVYSISFIWFQFCQYHLFQQEEWSADLCCSSPSHFLLGALIAYLSSWQTAQTSGCAQLTNLMDLLSKSLQPCSGCFSFSDTDTHVLIFLFLSAFWLPISLSSVLMLNSVHFRS